MRRLPSFFLFVLAACGGKIEADVSGSTTSSDPSSAAQRAEADAVEETIPPSGAEDGEWGTWQLLSVDGADGRRQYDPPFVELDLRPDGQAYLWTCLAGTTGTGERCPFHSRVNCLVGTVALSGQTWRVHFPTREGTQTAGRGVILDEPSGDITVKGEGALHPSGHYRRVGAASRDGCIP